jgi:hypothetical protein
MFNYYNENDINNTNDVDVQNKLKYNICKTSDGVEINYFVNEPIENLPSNANIILFFDEFNCPVDNLPNQVKSIQYFLVQILINL